MRFIFLWFLGITLACRGALIKAQVPYFEQITASDGLSQGMIFDLIQDKKGFLWFATNDGLNRYDGYNFKVFTHDGKQPFSIAENRATA